MTKDCLEFKQFKAWVNVDGEKTPCYAVEVDKKEKTVSCWIASEKGKEFWLGFNKVDQSRYPVRVSCYVDVLRVGRDYFKKSDLGWMKYDSMAHSRKMERPFVFSSVNLTDDDAYLEPSLSKQKTGAIGELTFKVHRITRLIVKKTKRSMDDSSDDDESEDEVAFEKVHERSKAGVTMQHQVGLGEQRLKSEESDDIIQDRYYYTHVYKELKELVATFTFRYRSLEVLQASGIAPCERKNDDPSASNGPKEVIVFDEDDDAGAPAHHQPAIVDPQPDTPMRQESPEPELQQQPIPVPLPPSSTLDSPEEPVANGLPTTQGTPKDTTPEDTPSAEESLTPSVTHSTSNQSSDDSSSPSPSGNPLKRSASEIDTKEEVNEDDIKFDPDMDGVEARKVAILAELAQIERLQERQKAAGPSSQKRVKREPSAPVMFFQPGEVIDLT